MALPMFRKLTIVTLSCISFSLYSTPDVNLQCQKIVIAGDSQWPPYTIVDPATPKDGEHLKLRGLGIDLARRIFNELDMPTEEITYDNPAMMMQGLRDGEIDMIVSTYEHDGLSQDVQLLRPAYVIDPITVTVNNNNGTKFTSWENLSGLAGIKDLTFLPDNETSEFIANYLQVQNQDNLMAALLSVKKGVSKFMLGSDLQMTYALKNNSLNPDLIVMKNLAKGGEVYMAFSKNSPCQQYAVYAQKRLQDYKNNGTVDKILKKYIN